MADEKETAEAPIPKGKSVDIGNARKADGEGAPEATGEESKDIFDLGLDTRSSFRMFRKTVRHYIAHEEYGVLFSHCGVRITKKQVEYNPEPRQSDVRCEKCKQHIWQIIATQKYAERLKEKKDLDD